MKRLLTLLLTVVCAASAFAGDGRVRRAAKPIAGEYIVVLNDNAPGRSAIASELTQRFGARTEYIFAGFHGFVINATEQAAQAISRDPRVAWVEQNAVMEPTQALNTTTRPFPPGWALDRANQPNGVDGYGNPGCSTAVGIRLYIVDSGINDIDGTEFGTRLRDLYKARANWLFRDMDGHGTAVASAAGGRRHGLARGAEIVNVRVWTPGDSSTAYTIDGLTRVDVDHYNRNLNNPAPTPAVVNISIYYRPETYTSTQLSALDTAVLNSVRGCAATAIVSHTDFDGATAPREQCTSFKSAPAPYGLTYVVGAGNNNSGVINGSPARLGNDLVGTITVGATMMRDEWTTDWRAVWSASQNAGSNYGPEVDIWAPGTDIDVARRIESNLAPGSITRKESGTSIASPIVAGQMARIASANKTYTSQQLEDVLKNSATKTYPDPMNPNQLLDVIRDIPGAKFILYNPGKCRS